LHGEETAAVRMLLNGAVVLASMKGNFLHHNVWLVGGLEHSLFAIIIYEIILFPKAHRMMMSGWFFVIIEIISDNPSQLTNSYFSRWLLHHQPGMVLKKCPWETQRPRSHDR